MSEIDMIWNGVMSVAIGCFVWWIKAQKAEFQNVYQMISTVKRRAGDHREEVAKDYQTKAEADQDRRELVQRFDKVEEKLDRILLGQRSG